MCNVIQYIELIPLKIRGFSMKLVSKICIYAKGVQASLWKLS